MNLNRALLEVNLLDKVDTWVWTIRTDGRISVSNTRRWIDKIILPTVDKKTRWNCFIPVKLIF